MEEKNLHIHQVCEIISPGRMIQSINSSASFYAIHGHMKLFSDSFKTPKIIISKAFNNYFNIHSSLHIVKSVTWFLLLLFFIIIWIQVTRIEFGGVLALKAEFCVHLQWQNRRIATDMSWIASIQEILSKNTLNYQMFMVYHYWKNNRKITCQSSTEYNHYLIPPNFR